MTALKAMQKEWLRSTEDGLITGVLIWCLSAAFDTVNTDLQSEKYFIRVLHVHTNFNIICIHFLIHKSLYLRDRNTYTHTYIHSVN